MSDSTPAQSSPATPPVSGDENLEINRSPEDYAKRLSEVAAENKKYRQEKNELKSRLEALENERLHEQGKFKEIAEKEKARADKAEKEARERHAKFALRTVESQVKAEAARLGCVDTDALVKLMDLTELEPNEDYDVDKSKLSEVMGRMQKEKGYLFQKAAPTHRDMPPGSGRDGFKPKDVKEMSLSEKLAALQGKK